MLSKVLATSATTGLVADLATDWKDCRRAIQSLGDFGYDGLVADLATDWMYCWGAVQSLGDFGYMGTYVGRNKALRSYGMPHLRSGQGYEAGLFAPKASPTRKKPPGTPKQLRAIVLLCAETIEDNCSTLVGFTFCRNSRWRWRFRSSIDCALRCGRCIRVQGEIHSFEILLGARCEWLL